MAPRAMSALSGAGRGHDKGYGRGTRTGNGRGGEGGGGPRAMRALSGAGRGQAELSAADVHEWLAGTLAFDGEAVSVKSV
jgi:hypothetical protein